MPLSQPTLKVEIAGDHGLVIVKMIGEARLEVEDAQFQLDRVIVHHPKTILVDCSQLTFLSSIGMSLFVNLSRTAKKTAGTVTLCGVLPRIMASLTHARLDTLFTFQPDLESALPPKAAEQPSA
jgi:anti-anti-sigma factor